MCLYVLFPSLTSLTYIELQPLGAFDLSLTSSTCFNIHRIGWCGWKALSLSFPKLLQIENQLNIKKVMSINVSVCSFPIFDVFDIHSITPLMCTLSIFDIALIFCTVFNAFNAMYLNTSNIKQCTLTHIDMHPLMYTQQIR